MRTLLIGCAVVSVCLGLAGMASATPITAPLGAFNYSIPRNPADNTMYAADANAVTSNLSWNSYYYSVTAGTTGTLTFTFNAAPGDMFSGTATVGQGSLVFGQAGLFNGPPWAGSIVGAFSVNGGPYTTFFTDSGGGAGVTWIYSTNPINVNGATTVSIQYTLDLVPGQDTYKLNLFRSDAGTFGFAGTVVAVPEPATMALLAFGGLVLLRRKMR